jgi:hypothetical protein
MEISSNGDIVMKEVKRTKLYSQEEVDATECQWVSKSPKFINLTGKVFGELSIIKIHKRESPHTFWFARCSCGNIISTSTNQLNRGRSKCKSCIFSDLGEKKSLGWENHLKDVLSIHPELTLVNHRDGKTSTTWDWYCKRCETPFPMRPCNLKSFGRKSCRCNEVTFNHWTTELREEQILKICEERGLRFNGWYDDEKYVNNKSRIKVSCGNHPEYTISINNFTHINGNYNCKHCYQDRFGADRKHGIIKFKEDAVHVHKDLYNYDNYKYECSRTPSEILCNSCGNTFNQSYDNHVNKGKGCSCQTKSGFDCSKPAYLYLQSLDSIAVKYGITNRDVEVRIKEQEVGSKFEHNLVAKYYFLKGGDALRLESWIKVNVGSSFVSKGNLPRGFTETFCISKLQDTMKKCHNFHNLSNI